MKITTRMLASEVYEAANENGNKVVMDMQPRDQKINLSPTELLLSSLAGCAAVEIVMMLKKRKKKIKAFVIETEGTRRDEVPRYFTHIHSKYIITSPDANEEELKKAATLTLDKYCSVASSLKANITFSVQVNRT